MPDRGAGGASAISLPRAAAVVDRASPRGVRILVDLAAIRANLVEARRLSAGGKVFAVVKADAYGHGAIAVARALSREDMPPETRADGFAVVATGEAIALRESGVRAPVLVLQGPVDASDATLCADADLWPVIHDPAQLDWYRAHARRGELSAWLKVDTGMGRLGVRPEVAERLLREPDGIRWHGVLSHLACGDEPGSTHARAQIDTFGALDLPPGLALSLANSAAVIAWPDARHDWARPGLMLYGCDPRVPGPTSEPSITLAAAMQVTTTLLSVKTMEAGAGVGYAQAWQCPEQMPIGLARIGYADGLPRVLDDRARVSVGGVACPVVGRVSMDSIAVDLRAVPTARTGDEVEIWGGHLGVDALAASAGTIAYELLSGIRGRRATVDVAASG